MSTGNHIADGCIDDYESSLNPAFFVCCLCGDHKEDCIRLKCTGDYICEKCIEDLSIKDLMKYSIYPEVARDVINELYKPQVINDLIEKHDELKDEAELVRFICQNDPGYPAETLKTLKKDHINHISKRIRAEKRVLPIQKLIKNQQQQWKTNNKKLKLLR